MHLVDRDRLLSIKEIRTVKSNYFSMRNWLMLTFKVYCASTVSDRRYRIFDMDFQTASNISEEASVSFMIIFVWSEALEYLKSLNFDFYFNFKILNRMDL